MKTSLQRLFSLAWALLGAVGPVWAGEGSRPNIIVILADDLGFADLACYGGLGRTPQLDRLAREGMRFTRAFSNARCMPSRLSLLTGLPPQLADNNLFSDIRRNSVTLAEVLGEAGYATYMVGKWHLGTSSSNVVPKPIPTARGFHRFYGIWEGAAYPRKASLLDPTRGNGSVRIIENGEPLPWDQVPEDYYVTDTWNQKAIDMIRSTPKDQPFFLYLAHTAPHWPLDPHPANVAAYDGAFDAGWDVLRQQVYQNQINLGIFPPTQTLAPRFDFVSPFTSASSTTKSSFTSGTEIYYAAVTEMDTAIGRLMEALVAEGRADNTLVIFLSDNGADNVLGGNARGMICNAPFSGFKLTYFEGGVATPMVAWWPGRIPANTINTKHEVHLEDFMATVLPLADAVYPKTYMTYPIFPLYGRSFLPALLNPNHDSGPRTWHWEHDAQRGVWNDPWKAIFVDYRHPSIKGVFTADRNGWHLYNLSTDRAEATNLAASEPARMNAMIQSWKTWATSVGWEPSGRWTANNPLDEGFRGTDGTTERAKPETHVRFNPLTGDQAQSGLIQVFAFDAPVRGLRSVNFQAVNPSQASFGVKVYGANGFPAIPPNAATNPLAMPGLEQIPSLGTLLDVFEFGGTLFDWSAFKRAVDFGSSGYTHVTLVFHPAHPDQAVNQTAIRPADYAAWANLHFSPAELVNPALSGPQAPSRAGDTSNFEKFLVSRSPDRVGGPAMTILGGGDGEFEFSVGLAPGVIDQVLPLWETSVSLTGWQATTPLWIGASPGGPDGQDRIRLRLSVPDPGRSFYRAKFSPLPGSL